MSTTLQSNLYHINKENNFSSSIIVKFNTLSPDKFFFSNNSEIQYPRLIEFYHNNSSSKKSCHYHRDFNNSQYIYFRNFDIDDNLKYSIPLFKCELFKCLGCGKLHNIKSKKCCSMIYSPIEIIRAKLLKITIPDNYNVKFAIEENRNQFLKLHFPDLTDMIILK